MKRRLALVAALSLMLTWLLGVADVAARSGGVGKGAEFQVDLPMAGRTVRPAPPNTNVSAT